MKGNRPVAPSPVWLGLFLAMAAVPAVAGDTSFGATVDVELINVEVWVTDRRGREVRGLTADDFEVREDGKPVRITHFSELRGVSPGVEPLPPMKPSPAPPPPAGAAAPGPLVVFFDQLHLGAANRGQVIKDLRRFIDSGDVPVERILILNQARGLTTEAPFGSSREEIDAALSRLADAAGGSAVAEKNLAIRRLQQLWKDARELGTFQSPCDSFPSRAAPEILRYAAEGRSWALTTVGHLNRAASFLAGVPGVKTLVFVSDSLETAPGTDLVDFVEGLCPQQDAVSRLDLVAHLAEPFRRLTRHANANRVTIYTLQASGLRSGFLMSADQASVDFRAGTAFEAPYRTTERDGLAYLATETGGRAVLNRNRFMAELGSIAREMTAYYSLAYEPPHGGDGLEHRIEVRAQGGQELRVRYRRGYRDKSADERMSDRLESALYLGLMSNPLGARLGAATVREPAGDEQGYTLPLHVMVPVGKVTFLPGDRGGTARLKLQVAACDDRDRNVVFEQKVFRFERPADSANAFLDLAVDLGLDEGVHVVAAAVRDEATHETSYVSTSVEIRVPDGS